MNVSCGYKIITKHSLSITMDIVQTDDFYGKKQK